MNCSNCNTAVYGWQIEKGTGMCKKCYALPKAIVLGKPPKKRFWEFWK